MLKKADFQPVDASVTPRYSDVATFLRARRYDISAEIDIGLCGVPFDLGVNFRSGPREGPAVLLLHGFPYDRAMWRFQLGPLTDAGYRVVLPDLPGFGRSEGAMESMDAAARDLHVVVADELAGGLEQQRVVGAAASPEEQQIAREQHREDQRRKRDPACRGQSLLLITNAVRLPLVTPAFRQGGAHATRQGRGTLYAVC